MVKKADSRQPIAVSQKGKEMRPAIEFIKNKYGDQPVIGAEIGVGNGDHAWQMVQGLNFEKLYLIDHWDNYLEDGRLITNFAGKRDAVGARFARTEFEFVEITECEDRWSFGRA